MNRSELITHMAEAADISKAAAGRALDAAIEHIILAAGNSSDGARIAGFGTFTSKHKDEREGRNPGTGEKMTVAAKTVVKFKPAVAFKDRLNAA